MRYKKKQKKAFKNFVLKIRVAPRPYTINNIHQKKKHFYLTHSKIKSRKKENHSSNLAPPDIQRNIAGITSPPSIS